MFVLRQFVHDEFIIVDILTLVLTFLDLIFKRLYFFCSFLAPPPLDALRLFLRLRLNCFFKVFIGDAGLHFIKVFVFECWVCWGVHWRQY